MANILTTRARSDFSTDREKLDFAEGIALLDPNENPFTLMTMKYKKKTSGNIKHSWFSDELVPETDTVDTTTACVTAGTTLYVDNVDRWAVGDVGMRNSTREVFLVSTANQTTGALTIVRDYGATSGAYTAVAGTFTDEETLTIIGNAFEAGYQLPTKKSRAEVKIDNYCQDQRTPLGITEVAAAAAVRGEADWPYQMRKAAITHQRKIEYQNIWGRPMPGDKGLSSSGTGNTDPAAGGGVWHFLTGGTGFSGTGSDRRVEQAEITKTEFLDWIEACFEYGGSKKVLYAPPLLRTAFDSWGIADLQTTPGATTYGLAIGKWLSAHGVIAIVTHKMLTDSSGAAAFLLDMEDVSWVTYSNIGSTRFRDLDPYKATGKTIKEAEYQTISCLELRQPKKHGVLYGMTSFAA